MELTFKENNKTLGMTVLGYELEAEMADNEHDLNWLNLGFRINDGQQELSFTDSCLLTWELKAIIGSLESILRGEAMSTDNDDSWIMEPTLQYGVERLGEDDFDIRVHVSAGCAFGEDSPCVTVREIVTRRQLERMVAAMKTALRCFPERFGQGCNENESGR